MKFLQKQKENNQLIIISNIQSIDRNLQIFEQKLINSRKEFIAKIKYSLLNSEKEVLELLINKKGILINSTHDIISNFYHYP